MLKRLRLFALISLLFITPCYAFTEYYVDFANGTDSPRLCTNATTDECKTLQYALDTVTAAAGGSRINVEYDDATFEQDHTATIDIDINAPTTDDPIIVQGYSVTVGDGVKAVIDAQSQAVSNFNVNQPNIILKDLILKGSTGDAISVGALGDRSFIENVKITNAGGDGIDTNADAAAIHIINCEITGTTLDGLELNNDVGKTLYNFIHDTTAFGIDVGSATNATLIGNVVDTTTMGIDVGLGDRCLLAWNTIYNAVGAGNDNLNFSSAAGEQMILINNIFNTATDDSIDILAGSSIWFYYNNVIVTKNVAGAILFSSGESTASPGFENAAGRDFNIGANMDDIGFGGQVTTSGSTTNTVEPGAFPYEETGGAVTTGYGFTN